VVANFSEGLNRAYTENKLPIPAGPSPRGFLLEEIGGKELESIGGKYVGGNVKGIDGTLGVAQGNVLVSFKSHDLSNDGLLKAVARDMRSLADLDSEAIKGTTAAGKPFQFEGAVAGRVVVIAVPETQVRYIISPGFINALRAFAEETKTVPVLRAVRNWPGRPR